MFVGCQTNPTFVVYSPRPTVNLQTDSTATAMLFWNFGIPRSGFWDHFNETYEHRYYDPEMTNDVIPRKPSQVDAEVLRSDSPPAYSDLTRDPIVGSEFGWTSVEHVISLSDAECRMKLINILSYLRVEVDILRDNIINLEDTKRTVPFVAKKPIFSDGHLARVELMSSQPSIKKMKIYLTQDVVDYNSIVIAMRHAGFFYIGLEPLGE